MSASRWDWSPASAAGLLTNEECFMLLDVDVFDNDDLFKTLPNAAAPKVEPAKFHVQDELTASLYPPSPPEAKPSRAELASDLLQQIENQCKQENIFPNWLEEKVELPIFEPVHVTRAEAAVAAGAAGGAQYAAPHTEELLREFETVYGAVELTHLTPPQSPPGPATQLLLSYAQAQWQPAPPAAAAAPAPYDASLLSVEQLVAERAAELASPPRTLSSAGSSPAGSPRSSDEEWRAPPPRARARPSDDRRSRKKEQNKNAATRYRQKKKAESEVLLGEEHALRQRHAALADKRADLQREIRYLKGLMRDLFKAKGLIK